MLRHQDLLVPKSTRVGHGNFTKVQQRWDRAGTKSRDFRCWTPNGQADLLSDVRCWVNSGKHLLALSISGFDPMYGPAVRCKWILPGWR
jgi:hypothetical protein